VPEIPHADSIEPTLPAAATAAPARTSWRRENLD
jgi:hypothetical protein